MNAEDFKSLSVTTFITNLSLTFPSWNLLLKFRKLVVFDYSCNLRENRNFFFWLLQQYIYNRHCAQFTQNAAQYEQELVRLVLQWVWSGLGTGFEVTFWITSVGCLFSQITTALTFFQNKLSKTSLLRKFAFSDIVSYTAFVIIIVAIRCLNQRFWVLARMFGPNYHHYHIVFIVLFLAQVMQRIELDSSADAQGIL